MFGQYSSLRDVFSKSSSILYIFVVLVITHIGLKSGIGARLLVAPVPDHCFLSQ